MSMTSLLGITPWPALSAILLADLSGAWRCISRARTAHQAIRVGVRGSREWTCGSHRIPSRTREEASRAARNREVLLAQGREAKERIVEREFVRVGDTVRKDLANYPDLHRALSEAIVRIEEDHQKAVDVPPEAPGWAQAVEAVANLDARNARRRHSFRHPQIHGEGARRSHGGLSQGQRASVTRCCAR